MEKSTSESNNADEGPPCIGLSRDQWIDKYVFLFNVDGIAITTGIVRASQPQDCVDSSLLEESNVGIYILESNEHPSVLEDWRFFVKRWPIRYVIYDGICLFF